MTAFVRNQKTVLALFVCLCVATLAATSAFASPLPVADLGSGLSAATLGHLPAGWQAQGGDWAVRLAETPAPETSPGASLPLPVVPAHEKENVLPRCLGTDLKGGTAIYTARQYGDFTLTYQMQHFLDRHYWDNNCLFRLQSDGQSGYALHRDRFGTITLVVVNGKDERVLATSSGTLSAGEGDWVWMKITAEGNRFRVWACTDGINFQPFLDVTDEKNTFATGNIGFGAPNRYRFAFAQNPWQGDASKLAAGAWVARTEQGKDYRQIASTGATYYQAQVDVDVANVAKAPSSVVLEGSGVKIAEPLIAPRPGINTVNFAVPLAAGIPRRGFQVTLMRGTTAFQHAPVMVESLFRPDQLAARNSKPIETTDDSRPITKADYMALIDKTFAMYGNATKNFSWDNRWGVDAILYKATDDKKYLVGVMEWARRWLHDHDTGKAEYPGFDFTSRLGFANAATIAVNNGDFSPTEKQEFLTLVADNLANSGLEAGGVINRSLGNALAIKPLLALVPDSPLRHVVTRYPDEVMADFMRIYEGQENSSNYLPITLNFLVYWIDQHDMQALYQDPRIKNTFENLLQLLDSDGGYPTYADYGGQRQFNMKLVPVFERLAAVYHDGRYKWAAHEIFRRCQQDFDVKGTSGWALEALAEAYAVSDDSITETRPTGGSAVLHRNDGHLDKLSLRSGWGKNDLRVMVDLISGCEHGDAMALSVLSAYKDGGQSLMDKAGRDITGHSVPLVREQPQDYPIARHALKSGQWRFASFDLPLYRAWGAFYGGLGGSMAPQYVYSPSSYYTNIPVEFTYDPARQFAFVLCLSGNGKSRVYLDDVKLVKSTVDPGKNASEINLEDFEGEPDQWIGNYQKSPAAHSGHWCGEFLVDFAQSGYIGKKFSMPLDVHDPKYDRIQFWYKIVPISGDVNPSWTLQLGDKSGTPRNYSWNEVNDYPVRQTFFKDGTSTTFAGFSLKQPSENGQTIDKEREFFFVKNKLLWVRDRISATGDTPWVAGPLWQAGNVGPVHGSNWYDTWIDNNLLYWFPPKKGESVELYADPSGVGAHKSYPYLIYEKSPVHGGGSPVVFDTVLIPHDGTADAKQIAASIKVLRDIDGVTLLAVGDDLLLTNTSGHTVSVNGINTDYRRLYLQLKDGRVLEAEGEGGTQATFEGKAISVR